MLGLLFASRNMHHICYLKRSVVLLLERWQLAAYYATCHQVSDHFFLLFYHECKLEGQVPIVSNIDYSSGHCTIGYQKTRVFASIIYVNIFNFLYIITTAEYYSYIWIFQTLDISTIAVRHFNEHMTIHKQYIMRKCDWNCYTLYICILHQISLPSCRLFS